ncbi:MAG TPA: class I SAM-dependent methyltransferase [Chloroflexota bacterium]|nr:class I SAM-dependent methyltransferase [Chloroflexota bacterium]
MRWGAEPELVGPRHHFRVALMARLLAAYLPPRLPGSRVPVRVLDAGAGRGTLARALARRGYAVTALDDSAAFLAYLRERVGPKAPIRLVCGDVAALPFEARVFDGAVCGEVLEHVADDAAAVAGLARTLRPGGVLVATVPAGRARYSWLDRWAGHARRYERAELRALVEPRGFEVLRLHHWGFPFGLLYERLVQRPVLGRHARRGAAPGFALRLGRAGTTTRTVGALFAADHLSDGLPWGPGLLLVARRRG